MVAHYYKRYENGYLVCVGYGYGGLEITEREYNELITLIRNMPVAPVGYEYRITEQGEYVLVEAPIPEPDENEELTADEALAIITGGSV